MNEFKIEIQELEFKYSADGIELPNFIKVAESLGPQKTIEAASWDYYYSGGENYPFEFIRFRNGLPPELTIKVKTTEKNNTHRLEIDLHLSENVAPWLIEKFLNLLGFKENFRIYKYCKIYYYEKIDIVYYIIYNENMTEVGRRIEIEARKDYPFTSAEEAAQEIKLAEQRLLGLGITPQKRLKKSNWEQFKK